MNTGLPRASRVFAIVASFIIIASVSVAFATPPNSPYAPGDTVAPGCTPGATNCTVSPYATSGANTNILSLAGLTTPLSVGQGGIGISTIPANSLLYASSANTIGALAAGTNGLVLTMTSGVPAWTVLPSVAAYTAGTGLSLASNQFAVNESALTLSNLGGTLSAAKGGTGQTSYAAGDMLYASGSSTLSKLSAGTNGFVLTLVGGVPSWLAATGGSAYTAGNGLSLASNQFTVNQSQLSLSSIGGTLGVAQGGTGTTTAFTQGAVVFAGASGTYAQNSTNFSWDNTNNKLQVVGTIAGTHLKGIGSTPGVSVGTGAGTGGLTAPNISVSGTDSAGDITLTTGNGVLSLGATVLTLTFASAYGSTPHVILVPANATTALLGGVTNVFPSATTSAFIVTSGASALTALTTYKWTYHTIE